jgi:type II secretory pathway pseudopilin PulG
MKKKYTYILGEKRKVRSAGHTAGTRITAALILICLGLYLLWSQGFMSNQTRVRQAMLDISRIKHAARLFRADFGRCPDSLEELVSPPGDFKYVRRIVDPWGKPYKLICPAGMDPGGVDVLSGGPDRSFGGNDTISSL